MSLGYVQREARRAPPPPPPAPITIATPRMQTPGDRDRAWRRAVLVCAPTVSGILLVVELVAYQNRTPPYIIAGLSAVFVVLSINQWLRTVLSMNLYQQRNRDRFLALGFYIISMVAYMASSLAIMRRSPVLQFVDSLVGAVISWIGFLVVFEGTFLVPSRQQWVSLFHILLAQFLWELRTYFVNEHFFQLPDDSV